MEELKLGYRLTEVGMIPEDWDVKPLRACLVQPPQYGINAPAVPFRDDLPTYIRITDITEAGHFSPEKLVSVDHPSAKNYFLSENDLVLARTGASVGKSYLYNPLDGNLVYAGFLIRVRVDKAKLDPRFLAYFMKTHSYWNWVTTVSMRSGQPGINGNEYAGLPVPIPPSLAEQQNIADVLSEIDDQVTVLNKLITKRHDLKNGAMQELLTGEKRLPGFSREWEEKQLGEIGESIIGLTYDPSNVQEDGLLVLRSSNVADGRLRFEDNVFVNVSVPERLITRKDDILICVRNGSRALIGKCALIDQLAVGVTFGAFMSVFRTEHAHFVFQQFQSDIIKKQIHENIGATINQITNRDLNAFRIPFPTDGDERDAIVKVLSDMDAEITSLEDKRDKTIALKQGVMQELLTGRTRLR